ncbi:MAG: hypothetical protein AB7U38_00215 [Hyphomicrobiales bacterium]
MKPFHYFFAATVSGYLLFVLPAFAKECPAGTTAAVQSDEARTVEQKTDEIVANAKTDPQTGEKEASTGAAKPDENWFGCDPASEDFEKCKSEKGRQQEAKADDATSSGTSGRVAATPSGECTDPNKG